MQGTPRPRKSGPRSWAQEMMEAAQRAAAAARLREALLAGQASAAKSPPHAVAAAKVLPMELPQSQEQQDQAPMEEDPAWIALASEEENELHTELVEQLAGDAQTAPRTAADRAAERSRSPGARAATPSLETAAAAQPGSMPCAPQGVTMETCSKQYDACTKQFLRAQAAVRICRAKYDVQFRHKCLLDDFPAEAWAAAGAAAPAPAPAGPQPEAAARRRAYRRFWERQVKLGPQAPPPDGVLQRLGELPGASSAAAAGGPAAEHAGTSASPMTQEGGASSSCDPFVAQVTPTLPSGGAGARAHALLRPKSRLRRKTPPPSAWPPDVQLPRLPGPAGGEMAAGNVGAAAVATEDVWSNAADASRTSSPPYTESLEGSPAWSRAANASRASSPPYTESLLGSTGGLVDVDDSSSEPIPCAPGDVAFVPVTHFDGEWLGFSYRAGEHGLGYYRDGA